MNFPSSTKLSMKIRITSLVSFLIVFYVMLYEWRNLLLADAIQPVVYSAKFIIPVLLFLAIPLVQPRSRYLTLFILFFASFMLWGLLPSLFSNYYPETTIQWLKFLPRMLFSLLAGIYFVRKPEAPIKVMKCLIVIAVLTSIQYLLLASTFFLGTPEPVYFSGAQGVFYGPHGILGNQAAAMYFPNLAYPILRLTGFWPEPSNASGFLFSVFFLAQAIYSVERKLGWRLVSYVCLISGFMTLSMAGYFALGNATLFGTIVSRKSWRNITVVAPLAILSLGLILFVIWGRPIVSRYHYGNSILRAITGVRGGPAIREKYIKDPTIGRAKQIMINMKIWKKSPLGTGFRVPAKEATGTAPILWLSYTGVIGVMLLFFRELQVLCPAAKYSRESDVVKKVSQAWVAMLSQHLIYGDWMSPMYLFLCVLVIGTAYQWSNRARKECPNGLARSENYSLPSKLDLC